MQIHPETTRTLLVESVRSGSVAAAVVTGFTLDGVLKIVSIGFVLLQGAYLMWKWHNDWRKGRQHVRMVDKVTTPESRQ